MDNKWDRLATNEVIEKTSKALEQNGMNVTVVNTGQEAYDKALELIPKGAEVLTSTSLTTETIGLTKTINESGDYDSVKKRLSLMDKHTRHFERQRIGSAPGYVTGSVHAITEDGHLFIASNSGSQLPANAYGASHVILVVSTKKIVKDMEQALERIYKHILPLEAERAKKAYGAKGSNVSKLLIINRENNPGRINMILVKENLGF